MVKTNCPSPAATSYECWKRRFDCAGAALLLLLTLPFWGVIAVLLLLTQGRPLFFRQQRAGLHGQPFTLLKFRTMMEGTPPRLPDRPVAKAPDDPRVTPVGRLLRRLGLDELPQLLNVLRGEMSLVGPRPLPMEDLAQPGWMDGVSPEERDRRADWLARRHSVLPGLTGRWQVTRNAAEDFENWITCDLTYVEQRGLGQDLAILLLTPWAVLRGRRQP